MLAAVQLLARGADLVAVSSVYETAPVGDPEHPTFFNAAVLLSTPQSAAELKSGLLSDIERRLHRVRRADRNAPRTIDLDIALYDDRAFDYTAGDGRRRRIPDPDLLRHAHAILPVAELLPELQHPETGETLAAIAARLMAPTGHESPAVQLRPDVDLWPGE